jgi:hypothetical protein
MLSVAHVTALAGDVATPATWQWRHLPTLAGDVAWPQDVYLLVHMAFSDWSTWRILLVHVAHFYWSTWRFVCNAFMMYSL